MPADPVPENSVTANNERQVEIEVVARAIWNIVGDRMDTWYAPERFREGIAEAVIEALDREDHETVVRKVMAALVSRGWTMDGPRQRDLAAALSLVTSPARNARHDDEAALVCSECGESDRCEHWPARSLVARSPQGEDHETVARALLPKGVGSWDEQSDPQRSYLLRQARIAIDAIDRDVHGSCPSPARDARPGTPTVEGDRLEAAFAAYQAHFLYGDHGRSGVEAAIAAYLAEFAPDDTPHPTSTAPAPNKENQR